MRVSCGGIYRGFLARWVGVAAFQFALRIWDEIVSHRLTPTTPASSWFPSLQPLSTLRLGFV